MSVEEDDDDENLKKLSEEQLENILDTALSAHHFLKDLLEEAEYSLSETNYGLIMKMHDLYEDWRTDQRLMGRKFADLYGAKLSGTIQKLGIEKARQQICEKPTNKEWEKNNLNLLKLEVKFYKENKEKIRQINARYLVEFLEERKKYVKEEKKYIFLFERIKKIYNEYKSKLKKSSDESGIFKNKDPKNPNKYRNSYEGEVITDFVEKYILEVEKDLNDTIKRTKPEVLIKKEQQHLLIYDQIYKKYGGVEQSDYDPSEMQDDEFRPISPTYDPNHPPESSDDEFPYLPQQYVVQYTGDHPHQGLLTPDGEYSGEELPSSVESSYNSSHESDEDFYDAVGGVKVGKSPRKKTAMEIHKERFQDPEFKKRLFATNDTRVQIFEKEAKKRHDLIIKKMWNKFTDGYKARFGTPNEDDNKVMRLLKINFTGQSSTIRPEDIKYVKDYRAQNAENRAKGHYIYKEFKNMFDMKKKMSTEFRRKREGFRKWDEQDSDGETTGEIALLEQSAEEARLMRLRDGSFMKLPPNYEGNLGKTSPVAFVDIGKSEVEMDDDAFNDALLRRGGKRSRRRRKKLKRKTKKRNKKKRRTKRKRIRRKRTRKRV